MPPPSFEDYLEITDRIYTFAFALDHHDWTLMRSVFADQVETDTSAVGNGYTGGRIPAEEMVWNVKVTETGFEGTQLLLANPRVSIDGDKARCNVGFYGEHIALTVSGDPAYTIGGYEDWALSKINGRWLIDGFRLEPLWTKGNRDVMNIGVQRGVERLTEAGDSPPPDLAVLRHRY